VDLRVFFSSFSARRPGTRVLWQILMYHTSLALLLLYVRILHIAIEETGLTCPSMQYVPNMVPSQTIINCTYLRSVSAD
jgi:hypothetical protein